MTAGTRQALTDLTAKWISLWSVPVDWALFDALHGDDFEDCSSAGRSVSKEGFAGGLRDLTNAFPDLTTNVEDLVIDEDRSMVAVHWSASGTNRQRYLGLGPTNRRTRITGIEIIEIRHGRVVRRWGEWDITDHGGLERTMELGALILFSTRLRDAVLFYRALGLPLEEESHDEGPTHFACELGPTHFAIFEGSPGEAPAYRAGGASMPGFAVPSLDHALGAVTALGANVVQPPTEYPWGPRFLVEDPDGRIVEVFERLRPEQENRTP